MKRYNNYVSLKNFKKVHRGVETSLDEIHVKRRNLGGEMEKWVEHGEGKVSGRRLCCQS
jgi:hypothetical protein